MEVPTNWPKRMQALLDNPLFMSPPPQGEKFGHRQYDDGRLVWWKGTDKFLGWGYQGKWDLPSKALLEAAGVLLKNQSCSRINEIQARELEFFLRDKNSQRAISEELLRDFSNVWAELQEAHTQWQQSGVALQAYNFPLERVFRNLSLIDKIHELKAFFLSEKLSAYYRRGGRLEVVDVVDCTVYLALDTGDISASAFLDWLQIVAAEEFREATLNLVPEAFPSETVKKKV